MLSSFEVLLQCFGNGRLILEAWTIGHVEDVMLTLGTTEALRPAGLEETLWYILRCSILSCSGIFSSGSHRDIS